ncbi:MAG: hypothetical protein II779_15330, partial [Clostridia bacterium]|nr:hypothetical protein [Clostridia bacterium]
QRGDAPHNAVDRRIDGGKTVEECLHKYTAFYEIWGIRGFFENEALPNKFRTPTQSCWPPAEIQARIGHRGRIRFVE